MADNKLFFGDNHDVLRRNLRDESVGPIYLDPPFNSRCSLISYSQEAHIAR